jgi:hypothetical protein
MKKVLCPVCWHEETFRAIRQHSEAVRDDAPVMLWQRPYGGARAQIVTEWDEGHWRCERCNLALWPSAAFLMIDAVLRVSDPDSDSYDGETFADARAAAAGGERQTARAVQEKDK